jgi:hypothetical protein
MRKSAESIRIRRRRSSGKARAGTSAAKGFKFCSEAARKERGRETEAVGNETGEIKEEGEWRG